MKLYRKPEGNTMKKFLFFDVDGTLYNYDKIIPASTLEALKIAKENGYEIAIATGRAPFMIKGLLEELNIHTYVSFNGQYVVYNDEVIFTDGVSSETLTKIIEFGSLRNEPVVFLDDVQMIASKGENERVAASLATLKYPYPLIDATYYLNKPVYQTLIFTDEEGEKEYSKQFPDVQLVRWHPVSCDILPKDGSKARGIQKLQHFAQIPLEDIYVFGDGLNDIEMLSYVPNSIAVGNGHPKAKEVAKYVTDHVDENGIYNAMKMLNLI